MSSVTKNSIAKEIFYQVGIPVSIAEEIVDKIFELIMAHVKKDKSVKIARFGSFYLRTKKSRAGQNLNTKQKVVISARNVVSFQVSKKLKDIVDE